MPEGLVQREERHGGADQGAGTDEPQFCFPGRPEQGSSGEHGHDEEPVTEGGRERRRREQGRAGLDQDEERDRDRDDDEKSERRNPASKPEQEKARGRE